MPADRVFVVGHRGMLGRDVVRWFREAGNEVATSDARFGSHDADPLIADVVAADCVTVVNCAGALPGRASQDTQWLVNALLPIRLAAVLSDGQRLIHAGTDGVFSGSRGGYRVDDQPDAIDGYGWSKRVGEWATRVSGVVVIRTSIIGPSAGLLGWLLDQSGTVEGYVNHRWSGVTTLEWARQCQAIVDAGPSPSRIEQVASRSVSKFELLEAAAQAYGLAVRVRPVTAPAAIDRSLVATIPVDPIDEQLRRLRAWTPR